MGFPQALWFEGEAGVGEGRLLDLALVAALNDEAVRAILEEALKLGSRGGRLLLGIARQISPAPQSDWG